MRRRERGRGFMGRVDEELFQGNAFLYDHMNGNGRENLGWSAKHIFPRSKTSMPRKRSAKRPHVTWPEAEIIIMKTAGKRAHWWMIWRVQAGLGSFSHTKTKDKPQAADVDDRDRCVKHVPGWQTVADTAAASLSLRALIHPVKSLVRKGGCSLYKDHRLYDGCIGD